MGNKEKKKEGKENERGTYYHENRREKRHEGKDNEREKTSKITKKGRKKMRRRKKKI